MPGCGEMTIGLWGAGGFGKTTLARLLTHRREIRERFPDGVIWVAIGEDTAGPELARYGAVMRRTYSTSLLIRVSDGSASCNAIMTACALPRPAVFEYVYLVPSRARVNAEW